MQVERTENTEPWEDEGRFEEWGSDLLVYHEGDGEWVMFDPEDDVVELDDWA